MTPSCKRPLGPALTRTPPSARLPFPGCSPDRGPRRHPRCQSRWLLRPRAAPVPAAPSETGPLPRAAGHATTPRRRPHGKRACLAQEARTLESWSRHCWGPDPACHPSHHTLGRLGCLQPCSPHSLPCEQRLIKASRGVLGPVVARDSGWQAATLHWRSFRHYISRQALSRTRPGRGTASLRVQGLSALFSACFAQLSGCVSLRCGQWLCSQPPRSCSIALLRSRAALTCPLVSLLPFFSALGFRTCPWLQGSWVALLPQCPRVWETWGLRAETRDTTSSPDPVPLEPH